MSGLEIKHLAVTPFVKATRTEHLAAGIVADKKELVGGGNDKWLAVCLFAVELEISVDASCYRVRGLNYPKYF